MDRRSALDRDSARSPHPRAGGRGRPGWDDSDGGDGRGGDGRGGDGESRPKRRDPRWARLLVIFGAVAMLAGGATASVPRLLLAWATDDIEIGDDIAEEFKAKDINGPINLLLLGMDQRTQQKSEPGLRTDSIILAHIPASHDRVFMISLPRDIRVQIPPVPATGYRGGMQKINAAFEVAAKDANGRDDPSREGRTKGANSMIATIRNLDLPDGSKFDLPFNGYAIINFDGFQKVLEAIGGVYMCIDQDTYSIHYTKEGVFLGYDLTAPWVYQVGKFYKEGDCYNMEPWEALDYARQREFQPNGDYDRQRHQQQLVRAILKKIVSSDTLTDFKKISELQKAAGDLLTLDLGNNELADWIFTLSSIRPDDIVMIKTNGGTYCTVQLPDDPTSYQCLNADSRRLLAAVKSDTVADFLAAHPDWVADVQ
jgi:anionic cell wall polymer biosynthesis LytR-Cps2A-Psr (LCP) family protein